MDQLQFPGLVPLDAHGMSKQDLKKEFEARRDAFIEECYKRYPKKRGKKRGHAKAKVKLTRPKTCQEFAQAVQNYIDYVKRERVEKRFRLHWCTFVNNFEDWITDEDVTDGLDPFEFFDWE